MQGRAADADEKPHFKVLWLLIKREMLLILMIGYFVSDSYGRDRFENRSKQPLFISLHKKTKMKTINLSAAHLECVVCCCFLSLYIHSCFTCASSGHNFLRICFLHSFHSFLSLFVSWASRYLWPTINTLFTSTFAFEQVHMNRLFSFSKENENLDNLLENFQTETCFGDKIYQKE